MQRDVEHAVPFWVTITQDSQHPGWSFRWVTVKDNTQVRKKKCACKCVMTEQLLWSLLGTSSSPDRVRFTCNYQIKPYQGEKSNRDALNCKNCKTDPKGASLLIMFCGFNIKWILISELWATLFSILTSATICTQPLVSSQFFLSLFSIIVVMTHRRSVYNECNSCFVLLSFCNSDWFGVRILVLCSLASCLHDVSN